MTVENVLRHPETTAHLAARLYKCRQTRALTYGDDGIFDGAGDDTALGGNGDDYFLDGFGNDSFDGGDGFDVLKMEAKFSDYRLSFDAKTGIWTILDKNTNVQDRDNDVLNGKNQFRNIEVLNFGSDDAAYHLLSDGKTWAQARTDNLLDYLDYASDILFVNNDTHEFSVWYSDNHATDFRTNVNSLDNDTTVIVKSKNTKFSTLFAQNVATGQVFMIAPLADPYFSSDLSEWSEIGTASSDWKICGAGDFDVSGAADILWRNSITGEVAIWFTNNDDGSSKSMSLDYVSLDWQIVGMDKFNNDQLTDILWHNSETGKLVNGSWRPMVRFGRGNPMAI